MPFWSCGAASASMELQGGEVARISLSGEIHGAGLEGLRKWAIEAPSEMGALVVMMDARGARMRFDANDLAPTPKRATARAVAMPLGLIVAPALLPVFDAYSLASVQLGMIRPVFTDDFSAADWVFATAQARRWVAAQRSGLRPLARFLSAGVGSGIPELQGLAPARRRPVARQ